MKPEPVDLLIIGAGPAGMAAAIEACGLGLSVTVLDEQASPGGQIYRDVRLADPQRLAVLGADYQAGLALVERFLACGARYIPQASVWLVSPQQQVHFLHQGQARTLQPRRLLIACGAYERALPIPGWTLPGVMNAGAGQILLKGAALLPAVPVLLAGCGPLLYLLAAQYLRAGVQIAALVDTSSHADLLRAWRQIPAALGGWRELRKGLGLLRQLRRAGIRHYRGARDLQIEGQDQARALRFRCGGDQHRLPAQLILLHQGVVPNTQISWSLRLEHQWDEHQLCWTVHRDPFGETSQPGVFIAGDAAAIGGALAAREQGRIAALGVARQLRPQAAAQIDAQLPALRRALARHLAARPLIDTLYRPQQQNRIPADDVIVCRCEEVSAGDLRHYVDLGCLGPNQAKAFGRCGMGPCQGRLCGLSVNEVIAERRQVSPAAVGYYRIRPPLKPITLSQLAGEACLDLSREHP